MNLFHRGPNSEERALRDELETLRSENEALRHRELGFQERLRRLSEDRDLLLEGIERLKGGLLPVQLAATLLELTRQPYALSSFYLALVDWDLDLLSFPYYHEGGRARNHPSRHLSVTPGLTGRVLSENRPLYVRTRVEAEALGAILTEAEKASGLIPESWYGIPLERGERPFGMVAFMSFQKDAFPQDRRAVLDALVHVMTRALVT